MAALVTGQEEAMRHHRHGMNLIDPVDDPSTPLRVMYTIAADGWQQWFGASKSTTTTMSS
jgi:hypothetical protein